MIVGQYNAVGEFDTMHFIKGPKLGYNSHTKRDKTAVCKCYGRIQHIHHAKGWKDKTLKAPTLTRSLTHHSRRGILFSLYITDICFD